jgi:Mlc titration factor MtfA (ptsG expression regulator)
MRIARPQSLVFSLLLALMLGGAAAVIGVQAPPLGAWLGLVPPLVIGFVTLRRPFRRWQLARRGAPAAWQAWLAAHVPFYARLPADGQRRFERDVLFFMAEQTFEGVEGVAVTEQLRLAVAAGAALLLHGRPGWELPSSRTILFYPGSFDEDYYDTASAGFDGMVHAQGPVILSVEAVEESWARPHDGQNVVLHELAHLFDFEDSAAEGHPSLMDPASAHAWSRLVRHEMRRIRFGRSVLRRYAATNPAEFFAVSVENFFERPVLLQRRHPELFEALVAFFSLDPRVPPEGGQESSNEGTPTRRGRLLNEDEAPDAPAVGT